VNFLGAWRGLVMTIKIVVFFGGSFLLLDKKSHGLQLAVDGMSG
jgi:hypothetical protein